jgi:hypothetical protein
MKKLQGTRVRVGRSAIDEFIALPDDEKERIWESFNREIPLRETRPLTPADRKLWEKAKQKGRPTVGRGSKVISLSVERGLLDRADALAKRKGVSRAALVAAGLNAVLAKPKLLDDRSAA